MSFRALPPTPSVVEATFAQRESRKSRIDEVLRAKPVTGVPLDALTLHKSKGESGLTSSLKNMTVTPVGACVPLSFDPDYCVLDRWYTFAMSIVTSGITALLIPPVYTSAFLLMQKPITQLFEMNCRVGWRDLLTGNYRSPQKWSPTAGGLIQDKTFCQSLTSALRSNTDLLMLWQAFGASHMAMYEFLRNPSLRPEDLPAHIQTLEYPELKANIALIPSAMITIILAPLVFIDNFVAELDVSDNTDFFKSSLFTKPSDPEALRNKAIYKLMMGVIEMKWVRLLLRKINEITRGVASYLRVNYRDWNAGKGITNADPFKFAKRVAYDILDDKDDEQEGSSQKSDEAPPPLEPGD